MDRSLNQKRRARLLLACLLGTFTGCVATPVQVPTVWDRLGITGATARLRDATFNRNGNFPGLEKKPPLLKLADPANLAPDKPEVIKTAAKIKQDKDLKKQKIKAIKFLAEVGCGCYNKDDAVAKALLEAMGDCDPDVKKAAIEAIQQSSGECAACRSGCETTCCSEDVVKKLHDMAYGRDDKGCFKEPDAEIRSLAAAAARSCPCPPTKPIEEVPAPAEIEEVPPTHPEPDPIESPSELPSIESPLGAHLNLDNAPVTKVSFSSSVAEVSVTPKLSEKRAAETDSGNPRYGTGDEPVRVVKRRGKGGELISGIANPDHLIQATFVSASDRSHEMVVELPGHFQLATDSSMVFVDSVSNYQVGKVSSVRGRHVHVAFDAPVVLKATKGATLHVGLIGE
jgi:hypothetical protein